MKPNNSETPPGCKQLIERLDQAVASADMSLICQSVKEALQHELGRNPQMVPEELLRPDADGYARRLLFKCPQDRFSVVVMVWDAGQGTPLHDHAGHWCVECVYRGRILVTSYDMHETQNDDVMRFTCEKTVEAGIGAAGALIPPFEYHTISNPHDDPAITIHVYGGEVTWCHAFEPTEDEGWFRKQRRELSYSLA